MSKSQADHTSIQVADEDSANASSLRQQFEQPNGLGFLEVVQEQRTDDRVILAWRDRRQDIMVEEFDLNALGDGSSSSVLDRHRVDVATGNMPGQTVLVRVACQSAYHVAASTGNVEDA